MTHNIITTDNYLLIVDDSEIKEGDYHLATRIVKEYGDKAIAFTDKKQMDAIKVYGGAKKIIAHLPVNNSPILVGVDLLPPLEDEVEKLADDYSFCERKSKWGDIVRKACLYGYNKAKEKYKYTEEDLRKAWNAAYVDALSIDEETYKPLFFENFIQSLQQPKMPVAFKCDILVEFPIDWDGKGIEPKTTTNSQGITQWVGTYTF
jgi:hypothetical protein